MPSRRFLRLWFSLLLLIASAVTLVAVFESAWMALSYGGGRVREVGFAWLLHLVTLKLEIDVFSHAPASLGVFRQTGNLIQWTEFAGPAIVWNLVLAVGAAFIATPLVLLALRLLGRDTGETVFAWPRSWRLTLWTIFLAPGALHAFCDMTIVGLGRDYYTSRLLMGLAAIGVAWIVGVVVVSRGSLLHGASRVLIATGLALLVGGVSTSLLFAPFTQRGIATQPAAAADSTRPNILLISIDSLRADHLHAYGYGRDTSPNLDALAHEGALFRYTVAPTSWTLPSHMTMLTSLPPNRHQVDTDLTRLRPEAVTLAEVLRSAGYETAAIVSAPYLRAEYGFPQGFSHYDDYSAVSLIRNAQRQITSPRLLRLATDWIDGRERRQEQRPFFLFLHMWDVHFDYMPPAPYDTMFDSDYTGSVTGEDYERSDEVHAGIDRRDLEHIVALYDGEIRWVDEHLGRLFGYLRERGLLDNTIVAVTADHGDEFFEHGRKGHRNSLYDEVLLVPLIIRYPDRIPAGAVVEQQARLLDLGPTLLSLAGVKAPDDFGMPLDEPYRGRDLSALWDGEALPPVPAFGDLEGHTASVRTLDRKFIVELKGDHAPQLYDLAADPGEQHNLAARETGAVDAFYTALSRFRHTDASRSLAAPLRVDPRHLQVLRSLGYIK